MVCGEAIAPYDRPPLSKAFLAGELHAGRLALRPGDWHADHAVELVLGDRASGPRRRTPARLRLASGAALPYDQLVLATGSRPRALDGTAGLANVARAAHARRRRAPARRAAPGRRLVVLGAGLIGQEVAATARRLGADVTLVEAAPLPLGRALHPELARVARRRPARRGRRRSASVSASRDLDVTGDRLEALMLADGTRVELDVLLVAIGVLPEVEWLGAPLGDLLARPEIHAAGDLAGGDHWEAAAHQGRAAARADPRPRPPHGHPSRAGGATSTASGCRGSAAPPGATDLLFDGDRAARSFTAVALRDGAPIAALAVDRPRELPRLRTLLTTDTRHGQGGRMTPSHPPPRCTASSHPCSPRCCSADRSSPSPFGASPARRRAAKKPTCTAGKTLARTKKRVRVTKRVRVHGKLKRKRVWVKKLVWVCVPATRDEDRRDTQAPTAPGGARRRRRQRPGRPSSGTPASDNVARHRLPRVPRRRARRLARRRRGTPTPG